MGQALFQHNIRGIFVQCSRKWGKTELGIYILWRWAALYPDSACYYVAPLLTQAREIVWADPRLQNFGPRKWLLDGSTGINNTEMRLRFKNGSFIKVDGSDNFEKHRGTRPALLVYEEYKDHRKEFREVMRPNLSVFNAPEIFLGTPPEDDGNEKDNEFLRTAEEHRRDPAKLFHHGPAGENPHIPKAWLDAEKARLYSRGEADVWEREYEARFVKGGAHKIFPMLRDTIIQPHDEIMTSIERDKRKLEWVLWADPAAASCFAVLFMAINPYTKQIYGLGEIYETESGAMTVQRIGRRILATRNELFNDQFREWRQGYDEAETWFMNEMLDHFDEHFEPTHKMKTDKTTGITLIKDVLLQGKMTLSDRCPKLFWELDQMRKNEQGKIPKKDDHQIDNFRYILHAMHYSLAPEREHVETDNEKFRGARLEDDFPGLKEDGTFSESEWESNEQ